MAEEQSEKGAEKKSGSKLWIILGFVALILVGGGGYAGWTMMAKNDEEDSRPKPPNFMVLEPFVITLKSDARPHYLQIKLSLMSREPETIKSLEVYRPMIRNEMIRYLGSLNFDETKKPGASDVIRKNGLDQLLVLLEKEQVEANIEELVITDMVIQ